jgi:hypothetical protein
MASSSIGRRPPDGKRAPSSHSSMPCTTWRTSTAGKTICLRTFSNCLGQCREGESDSDCRWKRRLPGQDSFEHIGGPNSPYYRYVFHQESTIDPQHHVVVLFGGQGVKFEYSFERYLEEAAAVITDCKAYQFFQLYDFYGNGFASRIGWAGQPIVKEEPKSR